MLAAIVTTGAASAVTDADWQTSRHGCPGYNTSALFRDDNGTLWIGCGGNAAGYGLHMSTDGGLSWALATVQPVHALNTFRVNSISRSEGGDLLVAGFNAGNADMVLALDTSSTPFAVSNPLLGTCRERPHPDGAVSHIATSLTGSMVVTENAGLGTSAAVWDPHCPTRQILDLIIFDKRFWASDRATDKPSQLFRARTNRVHTTRMTVAQAQLNRAREGRLRSLAINEDGLTAVEIDQNNNIGSILMSGSGSSDMSNYRELSVSRITGEPGATTRARGICIRGNRIVIVGERQPLSKHTGLVLLSDDAGRTFANVAPSSVKASVYRCTIGPNGEVVVVGADGFVGILSDRISVSGFELP